MKHADPFMAVMLLGFMTLIIVFLIRARRGKIPYLRKIGGIASLEEAVGRATEMGKPVVFAMGRSGIRDVVTHVALSVLSRVARLAARLGAPFIACVSVAEVYPFAEETVREAFKAEGVPERFDAKKQILYMSGDSIVSAMGVARLIQEGQAGCALFIGSFDFTSLLMAEPGAQMGVIQIAADPALGQIPFFVCTCDYTIIGEEYFAAGAYISPDPSLRGTLLAQDIIKVVLAAMIIVGLICYHLDLPAAQWVVDFFEKYQQ